MLPLALAVTGQSGAAASARFTCTEWTPHAQSNAEVIEAFLPVRFELQAAGQGWQVEVAPRNPAGG